MKRDLVQDLDTFAKEIKMELGKQQAAMEKKENGAVPT